jgi:hypothetical protein
MASKDKSDRGDNAEFNFRRGTASSQLSGGSGLISRGCCVVISGTVGHALQAA